MSKTFLNNRLLFLITVPTRPISIQPKFDLGMKMKSLNDKKQFKETIQLFDQYKRDHIKDSSSLVITQALKACSQLKNLQYGLNIHQNISSRLKDDVYILASLIHLYSKFYKEFSCIFTYFVYLKCNVMILFALNHYFINQQTNLYRCMEQ